MKSIFDLVAKVGDELFPQKNHRPNIGLYGDLDDVRLLEDLEQKFEIEISDEKATAISNVGDLFECISGELTKKGAKLSWQEFIKVLEPHSCIPISQIQRETEFFRYISRRKK